MTDFYARQQAVHIPGVPKLDHRHGVDGQRKLTVLKPLPPTSAGRKFELRNKVIGVYDKGKPGTVMETEQSIVDAESGEVYSKVLSSGFLVGQGNWGGPKGEYGYYPWPQGDRYIDFVDAGPSTVNFPPPEGKAPDATHVVQSNDETAHLYRYVS